MKMHLVKDRVSKALQQHFSATCFLIAPDNPDPGSIYVEWDSGPKVSEIQALTAPLLEDVKLYAKRSEPCFNCRTWNGTRGDENVLVCENCGRVL
jgi:hypothetical protein